MTDDVLPFDLGGGLRLRAATPANADTLAEFNARIHADDPGTPDQAIAAWTRDLLERPHPTFRPDLFTLVEEVGTGRVVSSLNLIPQTWSYGGVEFGVGRIELVGTDPAFRRRGLVRRQMEVAHRWSAEMGHLLQGITGIPWYYRQFGYEMALDLGAQRRLPPSEVPTLADHDIERYRLRPATVADAPFLAQTDAHGRGRALLACVRDETLWRFEVDGRHDANNEGMAVAIIEGAGEAGPPPPRPAGFVIHARQFWSGGLWVPACEIAAGQSWVTAGPSILRALRAAGEQIAASASKIDHSPAGHFERIVLELGVEHPLYLSIPAAADRPPYAWYIRIPDLPAFLRRVVPVLEARLAASACAGYSGDLRLNFYQGGLRLSLAAGKLSAVAAWPNARRQEAGASFPPLSFVQLLLGYRSLTELEHAFADCRAHKADARALLDALFPKRPSNVWPVS